MKKEHLDLALEVQFYMQAGNTDAALKIIKKLEDESWEEGWSVGYSEGYKDGEL